MWRRAGKIMDRCIQLIEPASITENVHRLKTPTREHLRVYESSKVLDVKWVQENGVILFEIRKENLTEPVRFDRLSGKDNKD